MQTHRAVVSVVRRVVAAGVMLALAFVGLVAQPADAGDGGSCDCPGLTISAAGSKRKDVYLEEGFYEINYKFSKSPRGLGASTWLVSAKSSDVQPDFFIGWGIGRDGSERRFFQTDGRPLVLYASAGDEDKWSLTFKRISPPTKVKTSISESGKGVHSTRPVMLEKGVYSYSVSHSDRLTEDGEVMGVRISLVGLGADRPQDVLLRNESLKGKKTGTFTVARNRVAWIDIISGPDASWKVKFTRLPGVTSSANPKISGTAKVGKTLTAKPATWKPSGVTLSYQWYRNGKKIEGATKKTYKLTKSDKGKKIVVKVKGKKSGYSWTTKASKATSKVT